MGSQEEESLSPPSWKDAAMKELTQGRDFVSKLSALLQIGSPESGQSEKTTAELLIKEIMGTMNKAMAALESGGTMEVNRVADPSSCVDSSKEGAGGKSKVQSTRKAGYRRRGCPYSWTRLTTKTIDDGHTWRKYGQKEIFSAKYPRSYFRCTHKFDQGCKASKQVQRSEDDPSSFVITYFGEHTCVDARKAKIPPSREPSADSASDYFVSPDAEFKKPAQEEPAAVIGQEHNGLPSAPYSSFINYGMELLDYDDIFNFDHTDLFQG